MSILELCRVKAIAGIPTSDADSDAQIKALIPPVIAFLENLCRIAIEPTLFTEYHSGDNSDLLFLRQVPVILGPVQINTDTVSPGIEINNNSRSSGGAWGTAGGNWEPLVSGVDYAIEDEWGAVRRLNGIWQGAIGVQWVNQSPPLSASPREVMPGGNFRATYAAGFATLPDDLALVATMLINRTMGMLVPGAGGAGFQSETLTKEGYAYTLNSAADEVMRLGTARSIVRLYRRPLAGH